MTPAQRAAAALDALLPHVPDTRRAAWRTEIESTPALRDAFGEGFLRQDEFSRLAAATQEERRKAEDLYARNTQWFTRLRTGLEGVLGRALGQDEDVFQVIESLKARVSASGGDPENIPGIDEAAVRRLAREERDSLNPRVAEARALAVILPNLVAKHQAEFGEPLDTEALVAYAEQNRLNLSQGGYDTFVKDKREAKRKEKYEADIQAAEQRGRAAARAELLSNPPFPTSSGAAFSDGTPATLSGLGKSPTGEEVTRLAVEAFNAGRAGGGN